MKAKKLITLCLVGMLAVTASTSVFASSKTVTSSVTADQATTVKYTPGTGGPTDPVVPGQEDTDPNNWMVHYDKSIKLDQNNATTESTASALKSVGVPVEFKVTRRYPGTTGTGNTDGGTDGMNVSDQNIGGTGTGQSATYDGTTGALYVGAAVKTGGNFGTWGSDNSITMYTETSGATSLKMVLLLSEQAKAGAQNDWAASGKRLSLMKAGYDTAASKERYIDTPMAAIKLGSGESAPADASQHNVTLTYTFSTTDIPVR